MGALELHHQVQEKVREKTLQPLCLSTLQAPPMPGSKGAFSAVCMGQSSQTQSRAEKGGVRVSRGNNFPSYQRLELWKLPFYLPKLAIAVHGF